MGVLTDIKNDLNQSALQLMLECRDRLYSVAFRECGNVADAEDLVSRTFAKAIQKLDCGMEVANLYGWLKTMMLNLRADDQRKAVVRGTRLADPAELEFCAGADWSTDEQIVKDSDSEAIRQALDELDPKYRRAMLMRYYDDFSLKEIADILRLPMGTVSRRIQIAHRLLAGKLSGKLGKKPLAMLLAALLGVGTLFGAWVSPLGDWVAEKVFGNAPTAEATVESATQVEPTSWAQPVAASAATQTGDNSILQTNKTAQKQKGEDNMNINAKIKKTVAAASVAVAGMAAVGFGETMNDVFARTVTVVNAPIDSNGRLHYADLSFGPDNGITNRLLVAWGRTDAGGVLADWEHVDPVGLVTAETEGWHVDLTPEQHCVRFFLEPYYGDSIKLPLQYVEANGTQYVDPEFKLQSGDTVTTRVRLISSGSASVFGSRTSAAENNFMTIVDGFENCFYIDYGTYQGNRLKASCETGVWYDIVMSPDYLAVTNAGTGALVNELAKDGMSGGVPPGNCYLFWGTGSPGGGNQKFNGRIACFKLARNGHAYADLRPCLQDGRVGFFDLARGVFYGAASGVFDAAIPGEDVANLPYLSMTETLCDQVLRLVDASVIAGENSLGCSWRLDSPGIGATNVKVYLEWGLKPYKMPMRELLSEKVGFGSQTLGGFPSGERFAARIIAINNLGIVAHSETFTVSPVAGDDGPAGVGRPVNIVAVEQSGKREVAHRLAFGEPDAGVSEPAMLYRAYGSLSGGENVADWSVVEPVGIVAPDETERIVPVPSSWGLSAFAVRYFLTPSPACNFASLRFKGDCYYDLGFPLKSGDVVTARALVEAGNLFGSRLGASNKSFVAFFNTANLYLDYSNSDYSAFRCSNPVFAEWVDVAISPSARSITNALTGAEIAINTNFCGDVFETAENARLASASGAPATASHLYGKIAAFTIVRDGKLLVDWTATEDGSGIGCFRDAGDGSFHYPTVGQVEYMQPDKVNRSWSNVARCLRKQPSDFGLVIMIK